jgi:thiol-disulfide isomerase/thioredoxin
MNKHRAAKFLQIPIWFLFALPCLAVYGFAASEPPVAQFTIPAPDSVQAQQYLGLKAMEPFQLAGIDSKIVVIEFFNALCPHCHANAPIVNKLYKVIQEDAGLRDVKVLGIAVGSEKPEVDAYRKNFKVSFPLFIDEDFAISAAMGGVDTPTTMVLATGSGKVYASHVGVIKDFDGFLKELRAIHKKL